jgi:hypothetical protein
VYYWRASAAAPCNTASISCTKAAKSALFSRKCSSRCALASPLSPSIARMMPAREREETQSGNARVAVWPPAEAVAHRRARPASLTLQLFVAQRTAHALVAHKPPQSLLETRLRVRRARGPGLRWLPDSPLCVRASVARREPGERERLAHR